MEFELRDRALYLPAAETLVCADLHVGKDAASSVSLPIGERDDLTDRFGALLKRHEPSTVVIAGDLLHSFDRLPDGAVATVRALSGLAEDAGCRVVVTPGNHDTMLDELWNGPIESEYRIDGASTVITHGHVPPATNADLFIVGHDHPTIEIEGVRRPCYLHGPDQHEGADVLMLPSFSRLPAGIAVNDRSAAAFQSPLVTDVGALRPIVLDPDGGDPRDFPPLCDLRPFL
jgi:putative SbcD/Mre11-related phosphoesterase